MPDNLSVSITADSTRARQQIGLLQSSLRDLRAEHRKLADDVRQGTAEPADYARVTRQILEQEQALRALTRAQHEHAQANRESTVNLRELGLELGHFAHAAGIAVEGIRALRFGFAAFIGAEIIRGLTAVTDRIYEINKQAREVGLSTQSLQTLIAAFEQTGTKAADAKPIIDGLFKSFDDVQKKMLETGQAIEGVTVLGPGSKFNQLGMSTVEVLHGATKATVDFGNVLKELQVDISRVQPGEAGRLQFLQQLVTGFETLVKRGQTARADLLARALPGGAPLQTVLPALQEYVARQQQIQDRLRQQGALITPADTERAKQYRIAIDELTKSFEGLQQQIATVALPSLTRLITFLAEPGERRRPNWEEFLGIDDFVSLIDGMKRAYQGFIDFVARADAALKAAHDALWRGISGALGIPEAAPSAGSQEGQTVPIPPAQASGGYIRGAGTGRSDSILARLSDGEFVLNARSVSRLGVGFLEGLNRFAEGGFIDMPQLRFAEGGPVAAASGGTPVHLHLGNQVFATTASQSVASALVSEAHRQAISSAGVKPSWYAGRAGAV